MRHRSPRNSGCISVDMISNLVSFTGGIQYNVHRDLPLTHSLLMSMYLDNICCQVIVEKDSLIKYVSRGF